MNRFFRDLKGDSKNPQFRSVLEGNGMRFDGVNDRCYVPSFLRFGWDQPYTVLAIFRTVLNFQAEYIVSTRTFPNSDGSNGHVFLSKSNNNNIQSSLIGFQSSRYLSKISAQKIKQGYNIVIVTFEGGRTNLDGLKIYINGLKCSYSFTGNNIQATDILNPTPTGLDIGCFRGTSNPFLFNSSVIKKVQIAKRDYNEKEVREAFNIGSLRSVDGSGVDYFLDIDFNQTGDPNTNPPIDLSSNAYTITPYNFATSGVYESFY